MGEKRLSRPSVLALKGSEVLPPEASPKASSSSLGRNGGPLPYSLTSPDRGSNHYPTSSRCHSRARGAYNQRSFHPTAKLGPLFGLTSRMNPSSSSSPDDLVYEHPDLVSPVTESICLSPIEERDIVTHSDLEHDEVNQSSESGGSSARKAGNRKTGVMGKGKFHHRRGQDDDPHSVLALDADGPYRTHLLFPGKRDEAEGEGGPRKPGSASFMKQMLGWGKKSSSRSTPPSESRPPSLDPSDPYSRGKQVSFLGDYDGRLLFERPDRRPNSYNCDPNPTNPDRYFRAFNDPFRESDRGPGPSTPGGPAPAPRTRGAQPSEPMSGVGRGVSGLVAAVGGQVAAAATGGKMTRNTDTYYSNGGGPPKVDPSGRNRGVRPKRMSARDDKREPLPRDLKDVSKDCFIIPQENLERFLPDGITLPREPRRNQIINILEVSNPQLTITFHLMGPLSPTTPQYDTPSNESAAPLELQREVAMQALAEACKLGATEGFLLKNLEKDSEYPYINYYVINKPQAASEEFFRATRSRAYDILNPGRVGYRCHHSIDLFEEAVSIARPPVEPLSKKPVSANTGYIVCVYQVFSGDDGEKFERNWLFWTGARMLYKNLPKAVGLRRITLHKSCSQSSQSKVTYLLLVECSEFMGHIGEAANLLPILRGRICGYTGIYRVASSF